MALILGELAAILKTDNTRLKRGLDEGRRDFQRAGRDMERDAQTSGRAAGEAFGRGGRTAADRFARDASGRLRDERGRFTRDASQLGRAAADAAGGGLASLRQAMDNAGAAATNILSNVWNLIPALSALAAGAVFAVPALYALGGALASLPALAVGGGAAVGTLALGFMGLSDAFKKTTSAGGAAVDKSWQVAQAQRGLANAQREVLDAQEALTRARADEVERLDDLNRALREAHLSEQEAALDEADAQRELADAQTAVNIAQDKLDRAKATGDISAIQQATRDLLDAQQQQPDVIRRAQLAYERSKLATESAKDSTSDLTKEQQRAAQVGVEGSDQVRAALDRQRQAIEAVADAQHALTEARKPAGGGGGGGVGQQLTKLAPSAREFVNVIKSLKPAFEGLRLDVQQRLFAGVGGEIKSLASAWLPTLHKRLGGMADTFNGLFKLFSRSARKPEFIANISKAMESVQGLIDKVGKALAGPGVEAFGKLAAAASPFLTMLGDKLAGAVTSFSTWIDKAEKSGKLSSFFETAARYLGEIWDLGRDVGAVIGEFFSMFTDSNNGAAATDLFDTIRNGIRDLKEWLADPENKEKLGAFIDGFTTFGTIAMDVIGWFVTTGIPATWKAISWLADSIDWIIEKAGDAKDWVVRKYDQLIAWATGLPKRMSRATRGMFDGLKSAFRSAINWMIGKWNGFSLTLGGGSVLGMGIPSVTLNTPDIPHLAQGGIVRATPGGRLVRVAEGGQDEAVAPLSKLGALGGPREMLLRGEFRVSGSDLVLVLRERIALGGGSVQRVIGSNA